MSDDAPAERPSRVPPPEAARAVLRVVNGPASGTVVTVGPEALVIGRDRGCSLVLDDPSASWHHAEVAWNGTHVLVRDLDTPEGTLLNGRRLSGPTPLNRADLIQVGTTVLRVLAAGSDAAMEIVAAGVQPEHSTQVGSRRRPMLFGCAGAMFVTAVGGIALLVFWPLAAAPIMTSAGEGVAMVTAVPEREPTALPPFATVGLSTVPSATPLRRPTVAPSPGTVSEEPRPAVVTSVAGTPGPARPGTVLIVARRGGDSDNTGAGIVYDRRGFVLTSLRVVQGAQALFVLPERGPAREATLFDLDTDLGLAIVRVYGPALPIVSIGDSDATRPGDFVTALGYTGVRLESGGMEAPDLSQAPDVAQASVVDAAQATEGAPLIRLEPLLDPGYGGGPLLNSNGEVIGIVDPGVLADGGEADLGVAVAINAALPLMQRAATVP